MRRLSTLCACALFTATLLAGCGQKGPLYMPDDEAAREKYDPAHEYGDGQRDEQQDQQSLDNREAPSGGQGEGTEPGANVPATPAGENAPVNQTPGDAQPTNGEPGPIPQTHTTQ